MIKTSVETVDPVTVTLTVEVEPDRVRKAFDAAAKDLAKQVSLPGFRPGKAPRRLIEQRVGKDAIANAAMERSLTDYYVEALQREELDVVAPPSIDLGSFDEDEGATFTATVEVRPEIDPPDHTGIGVSFPEWEVDEDDVAAQIAQMRDRFAEVDEVERPAADGDFVTIDLRVEVDGSELESAHVEDALYEIGSQGVTPKLDTVLVGASAGDVVTYVDALPDQYPEHGGEEATFTVTVSDVREKTLPDLDDDFATTASEFDTLAELEREVRDNLRRRKIAQAQHELRGRVVEAYLAQVDVPLPPTAVEEDKNRRVHQLEHQAEQYGLDVDALLEMESTTREEFEQTAQDQAEQAVKAQFVLDALGRSLDLQVEPADLEAEIIRHAQSNDVPPEQIAQILQEQNSLPALVGDVLRRKTIDAIVAAADVDGAPSEGVLIELGLRPDPDAETDDDATAGSRLIVPGQSSGSGELIVPGR